jgi:hypothetical protein
VPKNEIDQNIFNDIFKISIWSNNDYSEFIGKFGNESKRELQILTENKYEGKPDVTRM